MIEMIERTCQYCGVVFIFPKYRVAYGMGKYCSHKCADAANKGQKTPRVKRVCLRCGKEFFVREKIAAKGQGIYCSQDCYVPPVIKKCLMCGKEFRASPAHNRSYCSKECSYKSNERNNKIGSRQKELQTQPDFRKRFLSWIKERTASEHWQNSPHFKKGEEHPAYKGNKKERQIATARYEYKKWRKDVFGRDNYTCQKCGKSGVYLHAHHIKEWAKYPDLRYELSNGLTLCKPCHIEQHKKR